MYIKPQGASQGAFFFLVLMESKASALGAFPKAEALDSKKIWICKWAKATHELLL